DSSRIVGLSGKRGLAPFSASCFPRFMFERSAVVRRSLIFLAHGMALLAPLPSLALAADDLAEDPPSAFPGMTAAPVRVGVTINGHWKGNAWLRIRDDGRPCVLVSHWLEWGVAPNAPYRPDSDVPGHTRCVEPERPAPRVVVASGGAIVLHPATRAGSEPAKDDEDDDDDAPLVRRRYDVHRHQLSVRVDNDLMSRARGDVPFSRHDDGVTALRLDYQVNASQSRQAGQASDSPRNAVYATFNPGINVGAWRARSTFNYSRDGMPAFSGKREPRWTHDNTYLTRDIGRWRSKVTLGEGYTDSLLFESIPFTGAQMASEDSLLPDYLEAF